VNRVHRATVARRRADTREPLLRETRRPMSDRLGVRSPESDSLARRVHSPIAGSLARMLR